MKRIIVLLVALSLGTLCSAQFYPYFNYYNPYEAAAAVTEAQENFLLNNIRFDESALRQNPDVWNAYQKYLTINSAYYRKYKAFKTTAWTGFGIACAGLIPILCDVSLDGDGTGLTIGAVMSGVGAIVATVGSIGIAVQAGHIKNNKREFIYYLRTTNNGIGIVTLF